jgi:hypothetical protein
VLFCCYLQAGDDKKLLQVASRKKKLEERHGLERNAAGRKFKVGTLKFISAQHRDFVMVHSSHVPYAAETSTVSV